jgi:clan AA aspartic protease
MRLYSTVEDARSLAAMANVADTGKITTTITVTNRLDAGMASQGYISADQVRSVTLPNVVVDTGATTLCLPAETIRELGLEMLKETTAATAHGLIRVRIFRDATVLLLGREGTFECLELPGGTDPLLGVIPLEALGIELDLHNQRLRVLPDDTPDTYITIY